MPIKITTGPRDAVRVVSQCKYDNCRFDFYLIILYLHACTCNSKSGNKFRNTHFLNTQCKSVLTVAFLCIPSCYAGENANLIKKTCQVQVGFANLILF